MEKFELRTTLSIPSESPDDILNVEKQFKDAFIAVGAEHPGLHAFYVTADTQHDELEIGIQFDGIKERYPEEVGNELLGKAFKEIGQHPLHTENSFESISSLLVPA